MSAPAQRALLSGNRMTALGALAAGCRFFSGYPITPSSEIYQAMMEELPARNGLALAAPDEITALAYCVGASLAGHKAMTATSGPGFCLMIETVQYALMTETPLVIAIVQRLGPSTGGATQGAQGDVLLAEHCTSGGFTIPMFAPATAAECYELTQWAFHWSEKLRVPVILLSDKEVGMTLETIQRDTLPRVEVAMRAPHQSSRPFATYASLCSEEPPPFAPVGGSDRIVATGSMHDAQGRLRKNTPEALAVLARLHRKVAAHADEMARFRYVPAAGANTLIISYGITARAAEEATRLLAAGNTPASFLQLQTLFPIPRCVIQSAIAGCETVVVAEENAGGLYAGAIESLLAERRVVRVNQVGAMITPTQIARAAVESA